MYKSNHCKKTKTKLKTRHFFPIYWLDYSPAQLKIWILAGACTYHVPVISIYCKLINILTEIFPWAQCDMSLADTPSDWKACPKIVGQAAAETHSWRFTKAKSGNRSRNKSRHPRADSRTNPLGLWIKTLSFLWRLWIKAWDINMHSLKVPLLLGIC